MNCMKCGNPIGADQVFCPDCLAEMEKYPVKADTPIMLPNRPERPAQKRTFLHRRVRRPEERIASLKSWVLLLSVAAAALLVAFSLTATLLIRMLNEKPPEVDPGQNYSTGALNHPVTE